MESADVIKMVQVAKHTSPPQIPLIKSICNIKFLCRNNRDMRLQRRAFKRFEDVLDIRSFFKVHVNLCLLISLLLNKQQAFLLQHQHLSALIDKPKKENKVKKHT